MCEEKKISFEFSSPFEISLSIILRCTCDIKLHSDVWRNQEKSLSYMIYVVKCLFSLLVIICLYLVFTYFFDLQCKVA